MTGLRERKKLATATALSDAALGLAAEFGIQNVTVEAIAARADVSVRTFFNYYSAKEEAVVASHRQEMARLVGEIEERPADEPIVTSLRNSAHGVVESPSTRLAETRDLLRRIDNTPELLAFRLQALAEVGRDLAQVIAHRTGRDLVADPYPDALAAASIAVLSSVLRDGRRLTRDQTIERIDAAYDLLENGFGPR